VSLTGRAILVVAALLALSTPVVAVLLWDRFGTAKWRRYGGRLALMLLGEALALAFAFVAMNDYAGFVSNWSEADGFVKGAFGLSGTHQTHHHKKTPAAAAEETPAAQAAPITAAAQQTVDGKPDPDAPTPADAADAIAHKDFRLNSEVTKAPGGGSWRTLTWSKPDEWATKGAVVLARLGGGASTLSELTYVYLPPQYFAIDGAARTLPVLEMFTGYPGRTDNLIAQMHVPDAMLAGINSGQVSPMAVVMTRPGVTGPWDTECTDVPNGPQALTFYSKDVPAAVRDRFGLKDAPNLVLGDSTGGYCAAKIAMLDHPDFPAAVAMSGYFHPAVDKTTRGIFNDTKLREHNDLQWRMENLKVPAISLLLTTGRDDYQHKDDGYPVVQSWYEMVRSPMIAQELVLDHGGHDFASFTGDMPYALSWLSRQLPHSRTGHAPPPPNSTIYPQNADAATEPQQQAEGVNN
jgi:enterochelin esterase-like enzyme